MESEACRNNLEDERFQVACKFRKETGQMMRMVDRILYLLTCRPNPTTHISQYPLCDSFSLAQEILMRISII